MKGRALLIDTTPRGALGSMARYGDLVAGVFADGSDNGFRRLRLALSNAQLQRIPVLFRNRVHHLWIVAASRKLRRVSAGLFHVLDGSHAYCARHVPAGSLVVTAHDLIPVLQVRGELPGPPVRQLGRRLITRSLTSLERASAVVAISQNTARDLMRVLSLDAQRVHVVPPALGPSWLEKDADLRTSHVGPAGPNDYILHVGNDAFYKNGEGVLRIFAEVRARAAVRLKMAGTAPDDALRHLIRTLSLEDCVEFVVDPDDASMAALYRGARVFLFPSLYEGFGWPPLEAMGAGCPVVCSSAASLPEVVGNAAMLADAGDEAALAAHCIALLHDSQLADRMVKAGRKRAAMFTVEKMAQGLRDVYAGVFGYERSEA